MSLEEDPAGQASHVHGGSWSCWKRREPWKPPPSGLPKASHQGGLVAGWISSVVMLFKGCCGKKTCSHSLSIHGVRLVAARGPHDFGEAPAINLGGELIKWELVRQPSGFTEYFFLGGVESLFSRHTNGQMTRRNWWIDWIWLTAFCNTTPKACQKDWAKTQKDLRFRMIWRTKD